MQLLYIVLHRIKLHTVCFAYVHTDDMGGSWLGKQKSEIEEKK